LYLLISYFSLWINIKYKSQKSIQMKTLKFESFIETASIIFTSYMVVLITLVLILQK